MSEEIEKWKGEIEKQKCPWCLRMVTPIKDEHGLLCPECKNYIVTKTGSRTVRVEHPEEFGEDTVAAGDLTIDLSLESLPVREVKARAPFFIENWQIRMSQFQEGGFYAVMECRDTQGKRFRWNTSGKQVLSVLEEAERRGIKRIYVREVLFDEVGGRPRNIRIR